LSHNPKSYPLITTNASVSVSFTILGTFYGWGHRQVLPWLSVSVKFKCRKQFNAAVSEVIRCSCSHLRSGFVTVRAASATRSSSALSCSGVTH
jgi:hypothetical protein